MRLLQLNTNGNETSALDFHPMVTVVSGLTEDGRSTVIRAVTALPKGQDPGCHGLVEAHGILLDLDADTLALLDLDGDLDVLVRASDIPGAAGAPAPAPGAEPELTSVLPASVEPLSVDQFLAITKEGDHPELDAARLDQAQAVEALGVLRDAVDRAQSSLDEVIAKRVAAEAALDEARRSVQKANLRLVTDEFEPEPEPEPDPDPEPEPEPEPSRTLEDIDTDRSRIKGRVEELAVDIARIDRGIDELAGVDPRPIQVLLDAIRNPQAVEMVPSERANELADEFVRLQAEVARLEDSLDARGLGSRSAMARLDAARQNLAAAEKAVRKPELTEQDRIELEAAHDAVLEFGGKGRRGGKKRLEEAMAREQEILDRIGFPTWSAYVMGSGLMAIDSSAERNLELAKDELEEAEEHWSNVAAMIEADPVHRELLDKLEAVYLEAFDLLGGDDEQDDLEVKLRNLQVPKREVSMDELVDALAYQLELVGMTIPPQAVTLDRTVMIADAFLEEASAITDRLNELGSEKVAALTELESLDDELTALDREAEDVAAAEAARAAGSDDVFDLDLEIDLEALTEEDSIDLDEAPDDEPVWPTDDDLAQLEAELDALREEEQEYVEFVEAREALLDVAIQVESVAGAKTRRIASELTDQHNAEAADAAAAAAAPEPAPAIEPGGFSLPERATPEAIEFYLLARLAALRSVSYAGSVPLVIDDALADLSQRDVEHLLHKLERMSESVQIVYLSDDPTVSAWARGIGFERGAVVDAPASFGSPS
jgi:hypothetical protein